MRFFHNHTERGSVTSSGIPNSSSCSDEVMPRLKAERTKTVPAERSSPIIMPNRMMRALRGLTGAGCVTAGSIIRTFPIALEREMLSSC